MPEHKLTDTAKLRKVKLGCLIEHSSAVHFVAKASGNYEATFISGAVENQLGYEPIQFTQDPDFWINHVHPDDRPRVLANRRQLLESGHRTEEHRFMHADGDYRWIHNEMTLVRDKDGNPSEIIGTCVDITERRRSEEALEESEARYRNLVENTTDWIWEMGLDLKHTYSNRHLETILGYSPEEFAEMSLDKLMHPEDIKAVGARLPILIAERQGWEGWVVRFRHKDGSYRYLQSNAHAILDAEGETCGFRGVDRDITSQKEAEERLRQAQKMEAVGQLTGGMAHNFNNLLAIIVGHLEILKEKSGSDEKSVESMQAALDAAQRGADLVKRLLAFSGQQRLVPENMNINDVVKELEHQLKDTLGGDIEVHTKLAGDLWRTTIDKSQLENSLVNLAINARHAMPEGGVLTIETDHVDLAETDVVDEAEIIGGKYVVLAVSDTGTGIPKNVIPHIFEPFFTTKDVGEGSGLGLSMVHGFVKQSKGRIDVNSEVGHGTTIKIYLPQAEDVSADMK